MKTQEEPENFMIDQLADLKNILSSHFENEPLPPQPQTTKKTKLPKI